MKNHTLRLVQRGCNSACREANLSNLHCFHTPPMMFEQIHAKHTERLAKDRKEITETWKTFEKNELKLAKSKRKHRTTTENALSAQAEVLKVHEAAKAFATKYKREHNT